MIVTKIKKWGNSIGVIIPNEEVRKMNLKEDQEIVIKIIKRENPLKELFGTLKFNKSTDDIIKKIKKEFESKWI